MEAIWSRLQYLMKEKNEIRLLDLMAGILIGLAPVIHVIVVKKINVPYGRYTDSRWGLLINGKLAWFMQEIIALIIPLYTVYTSSSSLSLPSAILLGLYILHYVHRALIYPMLLNGGKPTPISVMLFALVFCFYNSYMQSAFLVRSSNYPSDWIHQPNFTAGIAMFFWGMFINVQCDNILRNLRKPGETSYKIPQGGMFEYVTGGNFFGESVEWCGWALACWSLQATAFAVFSVLFLSSRSYSHHQWYLKKFDDYPKDRKIFIPFII